MNQDLKQKSIASWANHYENAGYKVWMKNSLLHKPMEINGCIPDVFAMRKGQSIAVCVKDEKEVSNPDKYLVLREWSYLPVRTFIIAEPGEWPNVIYTVVS
jgi:hypothetical protein